MSKETRNTTAALVSTEDRIVRPKEASKIVGRSLTSLWRDERAGRFPRRLQIGQRAVGYRYSEVKKWMDDRALVTQETAEPVAIPRDGKRRGRPSKVTSQAKATKTTKDTLESEVNRFAESMMLKGLKPLKDIIPDGKIHRVLFRGVSSRPVSGIYCLDLTHPAMGIWICQQRKISIVWRAKTPSERESAAYSKKRQQLLSKLINRKAKIA